MANAELSALLERIADYLELKGINWKPQAYRKAALNIGALPKDVKAVYKEKGLQGLEEIEGVGKHIAQKIEEYIKTGKIKKLQQLKKEIPVDLESLSSIEGLGPKKIFALYKSLNIKNIGELEKAIKQNKVKELQGFGEKTAENLLKSISFKKISGKRKPLFYALDIAERLISILNKIDGVKKTLIAGSLGRKKESIGDIDILIAADNSREVFEEFLKRAEIKRILVKGQTKISIIVEDMQVDIRAVSAEQFGSATQYFIGSKEHGVATRKIAIKKGMKLSEYGLFKDNKKIAGADEAEIYQKLGMDWIPYELRENSGEIETAQKHALPKLIEEKDIQCDLQMHTTYSDGVDSIEAMALSCKKLGYSYCAITDHVGQLKIAGAMNEKKVLKQKKEIEKVNEKLKNFKVLHGAEVDILLNGKLAANNSILKNFDIVLGAIHQGLARSTEEQTKRVMKAMENPYMNILAHPTGRIIGQRQGYQLQWEKVFSKAKEKNIALEINAYPSRMDLNDSLAKQAKDEKVMLSIGTDSHSATQLSSMKYGIFIARRAWCEKKDILNSLPCRKLLEKLEK